MSQNSEVVPQKPYSLQQTFKGQVVPGGSASAPHSGLASHWLAQSEPQKVDPKPQVPTSPPKKEPPDDYGKLVNKELQVPINDIKELD